MADLSGVEAKKSVCRVVIHNMDIGVTAEDLKVSLSEDFDIKSIKKVYQLSSSLQQDSISFAVHLSDLQEADRLIDTFNDPALDCDGRHPRAERVPTPKKTGSNAASPLEKDADGQSPSSNSVTFQSSPPYSSNESSLTASAGSVSTSTLSAGTSLESSPFCGKLTQPVTHASRGKCLSHMVRGRLRGNGTGRARGRGSTFRGGGRGSSCYTLTRGNARTGTRPDFFEPARASAAIPIVASPHPPPEKMRKPVDTIKKEENDKPHSEAKFVTPKEETIPSIRSPVADTKNLTLEHQWMKTLSDFTISQNSSRFRGTDRPFPTENVKEPTDTTNLEVKRPVLNSLVSEFIPGPAAEKAKPPREKTFKLRPDASIYVPPLEHKRVTDRHQLPSDRRNLQEAGELQYYQHGQNTVKEADSDSWITQGDWPYSGASSLHEQLASPLQGSDDFADDPAGLTSATLPIKPMENPKTNSVNAPGGHGSLKATAEPFVLSVGKKDKLKCQLAWKVA